MTQEENEIWLLDKSRGVSLQRIGRATEEEVYATLSAWLKKSKSPDLARQVLEITLKYSSPTQRIGYLLEQIEKDYKLVMERITGKPSKPKDTPTQAPADSKQPSASKRSTLLRKRSSTR